MICPSLPQEDYDEFAFEMAEAIRVDRCEHVWAEVMNVRGKSFTRTIQALQDKGLDEEAQRLTEVQDAEQWEQYAQSTFLAHSKYIPPEKLRFLQYVKRPSLDWWKSHEGLGAVLLGADAKRPVGKKISKAKQARFKKLNAKITKAAKDMVKVGLALREIKEDKLYLAKFDTYEEYCQSVLAMSRQYANSLIRAGRAVERLETIVSKEGLPLPVNEGQVRELLRVRNLDERAQIYKKALKSVFGIPSRLTAAKIREVIEESGVIKPPPKRVTPTQKIQKARELTGKIEAALADGKSVKRLLTQLKKALGE